MLKRLWLWIRIKANAFRIESLEITLEGQNEAMTYVHDLDVRSRISAKREVTISKLSNEYAIQMDLADERGAKK